MCPEERGVFIRTTANVGQQCIGIPKGGGGHICREQQHGGVLHNPPFFVGQNFRQN